MVLPISYKTRGTPPHASKLPTVPTPPPKNIGCDTAMENDKLVNRLVGQEATKLMRVLGYDGSSLTSFLTEIVHPILQWRFGDRKRNANEDDLIEALVNRIEKMDLSVIPPTKQGDDNEQNRLFLPWARIQKTANSTQ